MANLTLRYLDELSYVLHSRKLGGQTKASSVGDLLNAEDDRNIWITPEESLIYAQEQRPPFIIPRITNYRAYRPESLHRRALHDDVTLPHSYPEESLPEQPSSIKDSIRKFENRRIGEWSPLVEKSRIEIERGFSKASSDSPPLIRQPKRLGGSNENLLLERAANAKWPSNLNHLPASSGDSLDLEFREHRPTGRNKKSRSMIASRIKSPVPTPRALVRQGDPADIVIFHGSVKRTKFSENGKKSRKHWTDNYLLVTPTSLVFYKDFKAYQAAKMSKGAGTPPSPTGSSRVTPELVVSLRNAMISTCTVQHTSRYNRSILLTVGCDQMLIQDESPAGAVHWLETIDKAIQWLPNDYAAPNHNLTPTMDSATSTPPSVRKGKNAKVGDSSNEDLSDTTEHTKVRKKLKKFFTRRPTMEALVKKGIYKDEPVFGRNLEEVCPESSPRVPEFVVRCVQEIESNAENMNTDGLYRVSGNLSQVQKIRLQIDQNNMDIIDQNADIHVLTGSLKLFFRELKEPLIPCKLFNRILVAAGNKSKEARVKEFREIVKSLPPCNYDTLKYLLEHLLRVTEFSSKNRMNINSLGIVFGPTLLWAPAELAHNIAVDCYQQNLAIEILLTDFHQIFASDRSKKK